MLSKPCRTFVKLLDECSKMLAQARICTHHYKRECQEKQPRFVDGHCPNTYRSTALAWAEALHMLSPKSIRTYKKYCRKGFVSGAQASSKLCGPYINVQAGATVVGSRHLVSASVAQLSYWTWLNHHERNCGRGVERWPRLPSLRQPRAHKNVT